MYLKNLNNNLISKIDGVLGANFYDSEGALKDDYHILNEQEEAAYEFELLKERYIKSRVGFLQSTDWYITREVDQAGSYPDEIKTKRILARSQINEIEAIDNEQDLGNYQLNFK